MLNRKMLSLKSRPRNVGVTRGSVQLLILILSVPPTPTYQKNDLITKKSRNYSMPRILVAKKRLKKQQVRIGKRRPSRAYYELDRQILLMTNKFSTGRSQRDSSPYPTPTTEALLRLCLEDLAFSNVARGTARDRFAVTIVGEKRYGKLQKSRFYIIRKNINSLETNF